jgi:RNA polymerase sigma-70 factor (ECF subfamily)
MPISGVNGGEMIDGLALPDFGTVYRNHYSDVHRFVFNMLQSTSLADELTQDTFVKAYRAWDSYRGEAPVRIWLLRVARNVCFDYLRGPRSRTRDPESLDEALEQGHEPATQAVAGQSEPLTVEGAARQSEMTECVQQFVRDLPETLRSPLILHDMAGLKNAEIAQVLDSSLEAAKMRLHRARVRMRQMMDENCDLFHDERNVLSCLPSAPNRTHEAQTRIAAT